MPPDQTQYGYQQFLAGLGQSGYGYGYGGYGYGGYGYQQPTTSDISALGTHISQGKEGQQAWGAVGTAASAIPQWYEQAHHAATMAPQHVTHPAYGLYSQAQVQQPAYGGPTVGGGLKDAASGALSGAAQGAAIGSAIPVIGTGIGAGIGAVAGSLGGFIEAGRANGMRDQWQQEQTRQQNDMAGHNRLASMYDQRVREKQATMNGFGQPYAYS